MASGWIKLVECTFFGGFGYNYLIVSEMGAATERFSKHWEEDICEAYAKIVKKDKHGDRGTSYYHRVELSSICLRSAANQTYPSSRNNGTHNLFNNDPVCKAMKELLQYSILPGGGNPGLTKQSSMQQLRL